MLAVQLIPIILAAPICASCTDPDSAAAAFAQPATSWTGTLTRIDLLRCAAGVLEDVTNETSLRAAEPKLAAIAWQAARLPELDRSVSELKKLEHRIAEALRRIALPETELVQARQIVDTIAGTKPPQ